MTPLFPKGLSELKSPFGSEVTFVSKAPGPENGSDEKLLLNPELQFVWAPPGPAEAVAVTPPTLTPAVPGPAETPKPALGAPKPPPAEKPEGAAKGSAGADGAADGKAEGAANGSELGAGA